MERITCDVDIFERIKTAGNKEQLDVLRLDVFRAMKSGDEAYFKKVQNAFIKQKNKLRR